MLNYISRFLFLQRLLPVVVGQMAAIGVPVIPSHIGMTASERDAAGLVANLQFRQPTVGARALKHVDVQRPCLCLALAAARQALWTPEV